jgi:putative heme-binding domain-containing protein
MHGLWALVGTGSLEPGFHARLLDHSCPSYRAWGVRAAGDYARVTPAIRDKVAGMARDQAPDVQLQVAIAARKVEGLDALAVLVEVLSSCGEDKLIPAIVWHNLHPLLPDQGRRFVKLVEPVDLGTAPALAKLLPRVVDRILGAPDTDLDAVRAVIERVVKKDAKLAQECLSVVSDRVGELPDERRTELRTQLQPLVQRILSGGPDGPLSFGAQLLASRFGVGSFDIGAVRNRFTSADQPGAVRLQALDALIAFNDPSLPDAVSRALSTGSPGFLTRVLTALGGSGDPKLADVVLGRYPAMDPELQPIAVDVLLQREPWARKLLDAVLAKRLPRSTLNANHLRKILESNDREAVWAVEKSWGTVREERNPQREKVVAAMSEYLSQNPGDPRAGRAVFKKLCAQCHTIYGEGEALGPDLTSNGRGSFDQLLASVFDPSLVIGQSYQTATVVTENGRNLTGLVTEDNDRRVVLALPGGGKEVVPRNNVKYTRTSKLSMMPEGIESILDRKDLADLFAFLALDRPPGDPRARPIPGVPGGASLRASESREKTRD